MTNRIKQEEIETLTPDQIAQRPDVMRLDEYFYDQAVAEKILMAKGIVKEKIDSANFEIPNSEMEIIYYPDEEMAWIGQNKTTFFIFKVAPRDRDSDEPVKYVSVVTAKLHSLNGAVGIREIRELKKLYPNHRLDGSGIGELTRGADGYTIRWGATDSHSQQANGQDLNYYGPYPSKFADWVKEKKVEQLQIKDSGLPPITATLH